MSREQLENIGFVTRLLRKQRSLRKRPLQFTTAALLLCVGYLACLLWLTQYIVRTQPLGIPLFMHFWFLILWTNVICGILLSQDARWYIVGGLIGVCLASPLLLVVYVHDLEPVLIVTGWACSLAFAMFANLGGGINWIRNGNERRGMLNIAIFVCTILLVLVYFDA